VSRMQSEIEGTAALTRHPCVPCRTFSTGPECSACPVVWASHFFWAYAQISEKRLCRECAGRTHLLH
jgi:hypothetical protein